MQLSQCLIAYLAARRAENLRPITLRNYAGQIGEFVDWLAGLGIEDADDVQPDHVRRYLAASLAAGTADTSVAQWRRVIVHWLMWLASEGFVDRADWPDHIPAIRVDRRAPMFLGPEQAALSLDVLRHSPHRAEWVKARQLAMLAVMLDTGVRRAELLNMRTSDVRLAQHAIHISAASKARTDRLVPIGKETTRLLRQYIKARNAHWPDVEWLWVSQFGRRLSGTQVNAMLAALGYRSGLGRLHPHALRHSCATMCLANGMSLAHVQGLLGHRCITSTTRYLHLLHADLARAHAQASPMDRLAQAKRSDMV